MVLEHDWRVMIQVLSRLCAEDCRSGRHCGRSEGLVLSVIKGSSRNGWGRGETYETAIDAAG
jgi:hypothetical protein